MLLRILSPDVPERTRRRFFSEFPNWLWHPAGCPRWGTFWNVSEPRLERVAGLPIPEIRDYPVGKLDSIGRFPGFSEWKYPEAANRPISASLMEASPALKAAVESVETLRASVNDGIVSSASSRACSVETMARASESSRRISKIIEGLEKNGFPLVAFFPE